MISTRVFGENPSFNQTKLDPNLSKQLRNAYFIVSSSSIYSLNISLQRLQEQDNKALIRKYYPKKVSFLASGLKKLPNKVASCIKGLKYLQVQYPHRILGSLGSLKRLELCKNVDKSKSNPLQFRKAMLAYKRINRLNIKGWFAGESLNNIFYSRNLQVLEIELKDNQLQGITKSIVRLELLKSINVLISGISNNDNSIQDPSHFLDFCEKTLTKSSLRVFKLRFDDSSGYYPTDAFEKLLRYLEKSNADQWDIQVMLVKDQVLRIAEAYNVFKQVQRLAVYANLISKRCTEGLTLNYTPFDKEIEVEENPDKSITIFLTKASDQIENFEFNLTSVLRECPKLECLFIEWGNAPLSQASHFDETYHSLKAIYFNTKACRKKSNWLSLVQILEHTPFLEKFFVMVSDTQTKLWDGSVDETFKSVRSLTKRLHKIKTLKTLHLHLMVTSQKSLDALQELCETLQDLEELTFNVVCGTSLRMPIIQFNKMTKLTRLRLGVPSSAEMFLNSLPSSISQLSELTALEFRTHGIGSILFDFLLSLMDNLKNLTRLQKFCLTSKMHSDLSVGQNIPTQDIDIAVKAELVKQEIKQLTSHCQELEFVQLSFLEEACINYIK